MSFIARNIKGGVGDLLPPRLRGVFLCKLEEGGELGR